MNSFKNSKIHACTVSNDLCRFRIGADGDTYEEIERLFMVLGIPTCKKRHRNHLVDGDCLSPPFR